MCLVGLVSRGRLYSTSYKLTKFQLLPGSGQQVLTTRKLRSNRPKYRFVTTRHTLSSWICSCGTCNFVTKITQSIWFEKNCPRDWFVGSLMILPVFMSPSLGLVHSGKLMTIPCSRSLFSPNSPQLKTKPDEFRSSLIKFRRLNLHDKNHYAMMFHQTWIALMFPMFPDRLFSSLRNCFVKSGPIFPNSTTCFLFVPLGPSLMTNKIPCHVIRISMGQF